MNITLVCKRCGKEYPAWSYEINRSKYCSKKCMRNRVTKTCLYCDEEFEVKKSDDLLGAKYCSRKCKDSHRSAIYSRENCPRWHGGRSTIKSGYILRFFPDHPFSNVRGYVYEHRLVMEEHLGRYLDKKEVVHHINGNNTDNSIDNLQLFINNSEHIKFHKMRRTQCIA